VVFRGEVSAAIEPYVDIRRHYIISGMARGGFSGGPVVTFGGDTKVLGIVSRALTFNNDRSELGFLDCINSHSILEILDEHRIKIPEVERTMQGFVG
jgi:hypothetical protein